jgi:hypothetical protein
MNKVNECPYCGGTFPHQGPTGCNQPGLDPHWMLDEYVTVTVEKMGKHFVVQDQENGLQCVISYNDHGRMLFDGFNIDTESFMAFVGMLDAVEESPNKKVMFTGDAAVDL